MKVIKTYAIIVFLIQKVIQHIVPMLGSKLFNEEKNIHTYILDSKKNQYVWNVN